MRNSRRAVQFLFLLFFLFLFIQTESKGLDELGYPVKTFLDFDPLIFFATLLSAHAVEKAFLFSIVLIIATIVLGRVFCGWICPLGTLHNMAGAIRRTTKRRGYEGLYRVKYLLLIFILASSLFSLQLVGVFDPLSLLIRSLSVGIYPAFNSAVRGVFDAAYDLRIKGLSAVTEPVYSVLKKSVLSFQQPHFRQSFFMGSLFLVLLGLNLYEKRFWCRYLCPLGGLLGLLSRFSLLKRSVSEGCPSCGACATVCQGNAFPGRKEEWRNTECLVCGNCDDICPHNAVRFGFSSGFGGKTASQSMDLGRRRVLVAAASGIAVVPMLQSGVLSRKGFSNPLLIRPPGSLAENEFLSRCVKCGECMKVCITNGLHPTLLEAGLEGIWSPTLVPRLGYCEYRCTLCGQVCPTGAIKKMSQPEKAKVRIGLAMIDKGRCLPYAHATPCIVCEEVCPTPKKAIWLEEVSVRDRQGGTIHLKPPRVDASLCSGCGICEAKCPVGNRAAIYVTNIGETRSEDNQLMI